MNRVAALARLASKLANPERRTLEEGAPVVVLTNGKHVMVERTLPLTAAGELSYLVSLDFGCTCRELGRVATLDEVLDIVLKEAA